MIRGLDHFRRYFKDYSEEFILVGGVATYLLLEEIGAQRVRATKDLDLVLMMNPSLAFIAAFKTYIKEGEYEVQGSPDVKTGFYRFQNPANVDYPIMIELFAPLDASIQLYDDQHIFPISKPFGVTSLSAILLDDDYYALIKKNAVLKDEISILNPFALIPFKAKAYLEIKARGEDSKSWKKHRGDIINLSVAFLTEERQELLAGKVREHFIEFLSQLKSEINDEVVRGACNQKIDSALIISLLEWTFL
jgi:hypothetical protein